MESFEEWWEAISKGPLKFKVPIDKGVAKIVYGAGVASSTFYWMKDSYLTNAVRSIEIDSVYFKQKHVEERFRLVREILNPLKWPDDPDNQRAVNVRNDAIKEALAAVENIIWQKKG